jgi:N,N'-diacetyllegionaminate synthase
VIAEAGDNHNGDFLLAKKLAMVAKKSGADAVKFQTFKTENLVTKNAQQAEYQKKNIGKNEGQFQMLKKLELSFSEFRRLSDYCKNIGILFLSTAFDLESIEFLASLDLPVWKIPSGEITNYPYIVEIAKKNRPIIMSTGMCEIFEVKAAVDIIKENTNGEITLLHCNTEYPTRFEDVNLNVMKTLGRKFSCKYGYSDHTQGISVPIAATALGASVIEKHFTLNRNMIGPDHKASLEPDELNTMVKSIREIEIALGSSQKFVSKSEMKNISIARKSIVAKKSIKKGEILSPDNITTKRPGTGITPMEWPKIIGTIANKNYKPDDMIQ